MGKFIKNLTEELQNMWRFFVWIVKNMKSKKGWGRIFKMLERLSKEVRKLFQFRFFFALFGAFLIIMFIFGGVFFIWAASLKTPDLSSFDDRLVSQSTKIYDRTGTVMLYDLNQKVRRTVVPFDQISPYIKKATVAIEDNNFYNHKGIEPTSIIRSLLVDITTRHFSQGGSTITQQVVKNSLLSGDKTISRKIKEWVLAIKLEQVADKDTILNIYLNNMPYGGNIYGVEEASQAYFSKDASKLTLAEAAYLAALPQAPTYYSPFGPNKKDLVTRKNLVLEKMKEQKLITQIEYDAAIKENVTFNQGAVGGIKAPHFVMFIRDYLVKKYGEQAILQGGMKVISTLDYDLQQKAEEVLKNYVLQNQKTLNASNGAMVAINPTNGQILVMVGSRDYFDKTIDGNFNVATAHRQPGSSFKPFVYATAFMKGYTPDTAIFDVPTEFSTTCSVDSQPLSSGATCYSPTEFNNEFSGLMSFRTALALSKNIPAVKVLYLAGINDSINTATKMGVQGLGDKNQYGLTLVLGGGEVSLLDMTSAYGVFSQNGVRNSPTGILEIQDQSGNDLEKFATSSQTVEPEQPMELINDILSDNAVRSPVFGPNYFNGKRVAMKTGTTNDSRDAWILGYTPAIVVGAWMGNNDNTPMVQKASAAIAVPMWKQFMDYALTKVPDESFTPPDPTSPDLKPYLRGLWGNGGSDVHSELFWVDKNNPTGPVPNNPGNDPQFHLWEYGIQKWFNSTSPGSLPSTVAETNSNTITNIFNDPAGPQISLSSNIPNNIMLSGDIRVILNIIKNSQNPLSKVDYYINNNLVGSATQGNFSFSFVPNDIEAGQTTYNIQAVATDSLGKRGSSNITITVNKPSQPVQNTLPNNQTI